MLQCHITKLGYIQYIPCCLIHFGLVHYFLHRPPFKYQIIVKIFKTICILKQEHRKIWVDVVLL